MKYTLSILTAISIVISIAVITMFIVIFTTDTYGWCELLTVSTLLIALMFSADETLRVYRTFK